MGYTYRIDRAEGWVRITGSGPLTLDETVSLVDEVLEHPDVTPEMSWLVDVRALTRLPSSSEARAFASVLGLRRRSLPGRIAVIVKREVDYGMARLTAAHADHEGVRLGVFRRVDEAARWLEGDP